MPNFPPVAKKLLVGQSVRCIKMHCFCIKNKNSNENESQRNQPRRHIVIVIIIIDIIRVFVSFNSACALESDSAAVIVGKTIRKKYK